MAALFADAVARHQHAGGIQALLAEEAHLRGAHASIGTPFDGGEQRLDPLRMSGGVVVQSGQIGGRGVREPLVYGGAKAAVAAVFDYAHTGRYAPAAHQSSTAVVHHDHFKIPPCLAIERFEALP